jgi:hypothetical protein
MEVELLLACAEVRRTPGQMPDVVAILASDDPKPTHLDGTDDKAIAFLSK